MSDRDAPSFAIPTRPERRFYRNGVEYVGETVFALEPDPPRDDTELASLLETVLGEDPYTYGDWFDVPMPLYLVHDDGTGDTFRVSVRDGRVELHVLPATAPDGLRALYERLDAATDDTEWRVDCRSSPPE